MCGLSELHICADPSSEASVKLHFRKRTNAPTGPRVRPEGGFSEKLVRGSAAEAETNANVNGSFRQDNSDLMFPYGLFPGLVNGSHNLYQWSCFAQLFPGREFFFTMQALKKSR